MSELVRLAKEALRQQKALDPIPTIQPGDRITWGAGGTLRGPATVDFLHTAPDGTGWAFCSVANSWVPSIPNTSSTLSKESIMSKKPTDREASNQTLPFPAPPNFGEPVAYLVVAVNAHGQPHSHTLSNAEQVLYLGSQALNYALTAAIVRKVQQNTVQLDWQAPWTSNPRRTS